MRQSDKPRGEFVQITNKRFVRLCTKADFETHVRRWFEGHGWTGHPLWEDLPESTTYVVFDQNNTLVAFTALYVTNSPICIMDWTCVNPGYNHFSRIKALQALVAYVEKVAVLLDKRKLIHFIVPEGLSEYFKKRLGFQFTETAHILVKVIKDTQGER
jgi:N-acetylglutamate synthase-like GNAT family acetyltransferase